MNTSKDRWDGLSLREKSEMMKAAVQQGIYNLSEIRKAYNEYAEGGTVDESNNIVDWIIGEEGFNSRPENIGDGKITLGSGLTSSKWHKIYNKKGTWTAEDNRAAVAEEVENRRKWAEQNVPNWGELPADSQNALLSYKYNYNFTPKNSPKLFKALEDRDYEEAARQMDATSSNPRFRKGLQARRQREQEMFMRGINSMNTPEPEVVEEIPQEESIYTPPQRVLDNMAAHNGRYMIMGNPPLAGVRNTVLDALRRLKALNLFAEGGPDNNPLLRDYTASSDNTYVNKVPITEDRIAADDVLTKIAAEQERINSLPNLEPVRGLDIVSPEFDVIALGQGLAGSLGKAISTKAKGIRGLTSKNLFTGRTEELPTRTMRGGIKTADGRVVSDEELVDNWKRSQDFYKMRLRNKGIEQKGKSYIKNRKEGINIVKAYEPHAEEEEILDAFDKYGGGFADPENGYAISTKELNTMGKQRRGTTNSADVHESAHLMRSVEDADNLENIRWSRLARLDKDEAAARGTQIKSMLGIKDDSPITGEHLRYMKDNMVRLTGMDNYMQSFLDSITDFDSAADWLSKNSFSLGGALTLLDYDFLKPYKGKKGL